MTAAESEASAASISPNTNTTTLATSTATSPTANSITSTNAQSAPTHLPNSMPSPSTLTQSAATPASTCKNEITLAVTQNLATSVASTTTVNVPEIAVSSVSSIGVSSPTVAVASTTAKSSISANSSVAICDTNVSGTTSILATTNNSIKNNDSVDSSSNYPPPQSNTNLHAVTTGGPPCQGQKIIGVQPAVVTQQSNAQQQLLHQQILQQQILQQKPQQITSSPAQSQKLAVKVGVSNFIGPVSLNTATTSAPTSQISTTSVNIPEIAGSSVSSIGVSSPTVAVASATAKSSISANISAAICDTSVSGVTSVLSTTNNNIKNSDSVDSNSNHQPTQSNTTLQAVATGGLPSQGQKIIGVQPTVVTQQSNAQQQLLHQQILQQQQILKQKPQQITLSPAQAQKLAVKVGVANFVGPISLTTATTSAPTSQTTVAPTNQISTVTPSVATATPSTIGVAGRGVSTSNHSQGGDFKYICCLLDNGVRCDRIAGNASYSRRVQKTVGLRKLNYTLDPSVRHAYICEHHKSMIQSARKSPANARETAASRAAASSASSAVSTAILPGANLSSANLSAANLSASNLSAANLSAANLSASNLSAANLNAAYGARTTPGASPYGLPQHVHMLNSHNSLNSLADFSPLGTGRVGVTVNAANSPAAIGYSHYSGPSLGPPPQTQHALDPTTSMFMDHHHQLQHLQQQQQQQHSRNTIDTSMDVDLYQLQVNTLRRYKRHFRVQTRPGLNKLQLAESLKRHFKSIPVLDKEAITYFVYMVKCNRNKLDHNARFPANESR